MPSDDSRTELNHAWWNERARLPRQTPLYQKHIDCLSGGGLSLLPVEVSEPDDIRGLSILHLQCHIGTDTLSLSRLGTTVTGVDFSEVAIQEARQLSLDLGIPATFERCEIESLKPRYSEAFDLVFTSHGVLSWLPDLNKWARQISGCVVPGRQVYLSESHPLVWALAEHSPVQDTSLRLELPYLAQDQPFGHL